MIRFSVYIEQSNDKAFKYRQNEIGRISKAILDEVNKELRQNVNCNQWMNSTNVIEWFMNILCNSQHKFIMFDMFILPLNKIYY